MKEKIQNIYKKIKKKHWQSLPLWVGSTKEKKMRKKMTGMLLKEALKEMSKLRKQECINPSFVPTWFRDFRALKEDKQKSRQEKQRKLNSTH